MKMDEEDRKFIDKFHEDLSQVDEAAQLVLNAHFSVEKPLGAFVESIFFHPKYIRNRFTFVNRVRIARAYTTESHDRFEWDVILALNEMRNVIAHRGDGEARVAALEVVRKEILRSYNEDIKKEAENANYRRVLTLAALIGGGFILILHEQLLRSQGRWTEEEEEK
jgi:hypothetical protein